MEQIFLLKQYINELTTTEAVKLVQECGISWLADTVGQILTSLLFTDPSFSIKILPKIQYLNCKIQDIINWRQIDKLHTGNA